MIDLSATQRQLAKGMSEAKLQTNVIQLAQALGYLVHAERPGRTQKGWRTPVQGDKGFPDAVLVRRTPKIGVIFFVEFKSETGEMSQEQHFWQHEIQDCSGRWFLWRPRDWFSGEIERTLRGED